MRELIQYIIENPIYCCLLVGVAFLGFKLTPYTREENRYRRQALIDKKYEDTFKK